jgi:NitT/TauT family transport system permease protein
MATRKIPSEQIVKALTLGASQLAVVYKVVLPQILPRLLSAVRLSLGAAWLFLIAAEAIASTDGLGYRIFLVRRYLSMDVIIPYVIWITFLGFTIDYTLKLIIKYRYAWYQQDN